MSQPPSSTAPTGDALARWARSALSGLVRTGVTWPSTPAITANRRAAVLLLFGPRAHGGEPRPEPHAGQHGPAHPPSPADLDLLLVRRSTRLRHHAGEVALPGGGVEEGDADICATALREAQEETGVDPRGVDLLGALPNAPVTVSRNLVTPVLGWWTRPSPVFPADPREIDLVRRVPLSDLIDPARRVRAQFHPEHGTAPSRRRWTPGVDLENALMWGFTGILVTTVLDALGWGPRTDWARAPVMDVTTRRRLAGGGGLEVAEDQGGRAPGPDRTSPPPPPTPA